MRRAYEDGDGEILLFGYACHPLAPTCINGKSGYEEIWKQNSGREPEF